MVTTTIRQDLWREIQMRAIADGCNVNDILERLLDFYLQWTGELVKLYSPGDKRAPGLNDEQRRVFELAFFRLREESKRRPITKEQCAVLGKQVIERGWVLVNPDTYYDCRTAWKQWDGVNPPIPATPEEIAEAKVNDKSSCPL